MASLAATLLCYYDEETTFIMLVRMFELRGLEKLYQAGFGGLMQALDEFEGSWMKGGQVSRRLVRWIPSPLANLPSLRAGHAGEPPPEFQDRGGAEKSLGLFLQTGGKRKEKRKTKAAAVQTAGEGWADGVLVVTEATGATAGGRGFSSSQPLN